MDLGSVEVSVVLSVLQVAALPDVLLHVLPRGEAVVLTVAVVVSGLP